MAYIYRQKRDGVWYLIDKSKQPSWVRLGRISQAEAKTCLRKYEADSTYLRLDLPLPPSKLTIQNLVNEYLNSMEGFRAEYTQKRECYRLIHFCKTFGDRPIHTLSLSEVEAYLSQKNYKPWTWRHVALSVKAIYRFAVKKKYLPKNPMSEIKLPKIGKSIPRFVDPTILDQILSHMCGAIRLYYLILRYTGMRPGEALKLQVKNIRELSYTDKTSGEIISRAMFFFRSFKTSTDRVIPIHPNLMSELKEWVKNKKPDDFLFPSLDGEGHQKSMKMGLRRALEKAGLKGISMYTFRHSVATDILAKTGDLRAVQTILGHSSSKTTEIYAHTLEAAKFKAIDLL